MAAPSSEEPAISDELYSAPGIGVEPSVESVAAAGVVDATVRFFIAAGWQR
jgi:hypothetical protein